MRDRESLDPPPFTQQQASRRSAWATVAAPPTDTLPAPPAPSWATPAELASAPTYRRGLPPVPTTYGDLDRVLGGGLRPECVYVLAGRTGSAKSTLAANIIARLRKRRTRGCRMRRYTHAEHASARSRSLMPPPQSQQNRKNARSRRAVSAISGFRSASGQPTGKASTMK